MRERVDKMLYLTEMVLFITILSLIMNKYKDVNFTNYTVYSDYNSGTYYLLKSDYLNEMLNSTSILTHEKSTDNLNNFAGHCRGFLDYDTACGVSTSLAGMYYTLNKLLHVLCFTIMKLVLISPWKNRIQTFVLEKTKLRKSTCNLLTGFALSGCVLVLFSGIISADEESTLCFNYVPSSYMNFSWLNTVLNEEGTLTITTTDVLMNLYLMGAGLAVLKMIATVTKLELSFPVFSSIREYLAYLFYLFITLGAAFFVICGLALTILLYAYHSSSLLLLLIYASRDLVFLMSYSYQRSVLDV